MASKQERQMALLRVLAAAAWADGRLDNEEVNHIKELMLAYELRPENIGEIDSLLAAPISYSRCEELTRDLVGMLGSAAERTEVLAEIESILRADGEFTAEEEEVLEGLSGVMDAMTSVDHFMGRVTGVFRNMFKSRDKSRDPGRLTGFLKNAVLQRLHDLSGGKWEEEIDAVTLNRYTLFGAVLGRIAEAEGGVVPEELLEIRRILEQRFHISPPLLEWVCQAVEEAASADVDRQGLLSEYNRISGIEDRKELLDAAFAVAAADGVVGKPELEELRLISNFLWIDPREFGTIRSRWVRE